jgi:hypothetical protein
MRITKLIRIRRFLETIEVLLMIFWLILSLWKLILDL